MRVTKPMSLILDVAKVTSNVPLPTTTGTGTDPALWDTSASYIEGERVYVAGTTNKIYQNIFEGTTDNTVASPEIDVLEITPKWAEISYVNKWKMFDLTRDTTTYSAEGTTNITITLTPGIVVSSVAVLGLVGVTDILITGTIGGTPTYNVAGVHYTGASITNYVVYDLPASATLILTIVLTGSSSVGCTQVVLGNPEILGDTQSDIIRDSINFSTVDRDTYGTSTLVKRKSVPKLKYSVNTLAAEIDRILVVREQLNAEVALWSGLDDNITDGYYDALLVLGFFRNFSIILDNEISSTIYLELEELSTGYALYVIAPIAPCDPYWAYVVLLVKPDGSLIDSSTYVHTLTPETGVVYNGTELAIEAPSSGNTWLTTPSNATLNIGTGDFTIELEFKKTNFAVTHYPIMFYDNAQSIYRVLFYLAGGTTPSVICYGTGYANFSITAANTVNTGVWGHVAFIKSGTNYVLAVDGIGNFEAPASFAPALFSGNGSIYINGNPQYGGEMHSAYLRNVRVTKAVRYTANFTPPTSYPTSSCIAPCDEYFGHVVVLIQPIGTDNSTTFIDESAYANSITVRNQAKQSTEQQINGLNSIECDGNGDALRLAANPVFNISNLEDFTLEFCVRFNTVTSRQIFIGFNGSVIAYFDMHRNSNSKLVWADSAYLSEFDQVLAVDVWYHIAISRSGTNLKGFIDGTTRFTQASHNATFYGDGANGLEFGAAPGIAGDSFGLNGYITQIRYTVGYARYTADFTPPTEKFIDNVCSGQDPLFPVVDVLFHFDGTDGSTTNIQSGVRTFTQHSFLNSSTISDAQSKFGGTSILSNSGSGSNLRSLSTDHPGWPSSNWCIEAWVWCDPGSTYHIPFSLSYYQNDSDCLRLYANGADWYVVCAGVTYISGTWTPITSGWYFVRIDTVSNSSNPCMKLFVNEVLIGTKATAAYVSNVQYYHIGAAPGLGIMTGYVDEFRLTCASRGQSPITIPTAPFPNS